MKKLGMLSVAFAGLMVVGASSDAIGAVRTAKRPGFKLSEANKKKLFAIMKEKGAKNVFAGLSDAQKKKLHAIVREKSSKVKLAKKVESTGDVNVTTPNVVVQQQAKADSKSSESDKVSEAAQQKKSQMTLEELAKKNLTELSEKLAKVNRAIVLSGDMVRIHEKNVQEQKKLLNDLSFNPLDHDLSVFTGDERAEVRNCLFPRGDAQALSQGVCEKVKNVFDSKRLPKLIAAARGISDELNAAKLDVDKIVKGADDELVSFVKKAQEEHDRLSRRSQAAGALSEQLNALCNDLTASLGYIAGRLHQDNSLGGVDFSAIFGEKSNIARGLYKEPSASAVDGSFLGSRIARIFHNADAGASNNDGLAASSGNNWPL
ncbi:hypothetical protein [Candidatus Hydrogenosomobacter endosymbioticus]|uniref:Uncharacterized protein n=1 Tax=Candidatus Hydrogenosomobacter endosymbioticus TaxID=2558174 RepID=A0ABN6L2I2_9PROT|nr:hypothetical protein [Candidatus Hydrogenosomobacter endosymbioticus]BDB96088.1 hypothetical protein HYD_2210 [Candidatus Hydrogenosomobacter endosymbioticus]